MLKNILAIVAALALAGAGTEVVAAEKKQASGQKSSGIQMYRYRNEKGQLVIESAIPPEFASKGYQILDGAGRVLQDVPAAISAEEKAAQRQQQEQAAVINRKDAELRKLYSSPQDAERLRDRQIESLLIKMDFVKGQLQQVNTKRRAEIEQAAKLERKGQPVPSSTKENIDRMNRQVVDLEGQVKALEGERNRIVQEFAPIIDRLKFIYPDKNAAGAAPAAGAATTAPATAPAPAAPR